MKSTEELRQDHKVILRVLNVLGRIVQVSEGDAALDVASIRKSLEFSRTFVDACHHHKEERCLFPCLESRGIPREGGPIGVMLAEHQQGRELVRRIGEALDKHEQGTGDKQEVRALCAAYIALLRQHIFKEDNILFSMVDAALTPADDDQTQTCYQGAEASLPPGTHEAMQRLALGLETQYK